MGFMAANFWIRTNGNVVKIDNLGQWSEQTALKFEREIHKVIPNIESDKFAKLL